VFLLGRDLSARGRYGLPLLVAVDPSYLAFNAPMRLAVVDLPRIQVPAQRCESRSGYDRHPDYAPNVIFPSGDSSVMRTDSPLIWFIE
jgi:hypothetical protein